MRVLFAQFDGRCRHCPKNIKPGQKIIRDRGGWQHLECYARRSSERTGRPAAPKPQGAGR